MHRRGEAFVGFAPVPANGEAMLRLKPTRLLAIAGVALVAFLYWKPTQSYLHTKRELLVLTGRARPALDAAARFEAGDRSHEVPARDVELRRERASVLVEGGLLGHGGPAEGAPDGDARKRTRPAAKLALDNCDVVHARNRSC